MMGWKRGRVSLIVEKPVRGKRKRLVAWVNGEYHSLAIFKDDEAAELFDRVFDYLIEGTKKNG